MRHRSLAKELRGTVLEILGTAVSVGCQIDNRSPKDVSADVKSGEIDSKFWICRLVVFLGRFMLMMCFCLVPAE